MAMLKPETKMLAHNTDVMMMMMKLKENVKKKNTMTSPVIQCLKNNKSGSQQKKDNKEMEQKIEHIRQ
jgi:uncharacterized protein YgiM (DUF1202 family)